MTQPTRRRFLATGTAAIGSAALNAKTYAQTPGANERMGVGLIGPGGMGTYHLRTLMAQPDIALLHIAEPDRTRLGAAVTAATREGRAPRGDADLRRVLDNREITAVFIATPDHWHAPAALLAFDAGKHVYVEKPCSHNIREGRLMVEAARRTNKVCQVGTQGRNAPHVKAAIDLLREGAIGDVLEVRVWNSQLRRSIGRQQPANPPENLDFDLWTGPAPQVPYRSNLLHSSWRWFHNFGAGDMGNDGVHELDIARWGLGAETHPSTITALGGKHFFDDDQEFPDTQTVIFEWPDIGGKKKQMIFEQRIWSPYKIEGYENGKAFYGTRGMLILGKETGWRLYGERNREIRTMNGEVTLRPHHREFFECIRNGRRPSCDIEVGHLSATLCHLGNIATRVRRVLSFNPQTEEIHNDKEATPLVRRQYRDHWATPRGV